MLWLFVAMIHHDTTGGLERFLFSHILGFTVQFHVVCNMVLRAHGFPCATQNRPEVDKRN